MKDKVKEMVDKFRTHDDSLFNVNNNLSNLRTLINENSAQIKTGKKDLDTQLERIEKLENDALLAKDEMDTKMENASTELSSIKENYISKKLYEDHSTSMRD